MVAGQCDEGPRRSNGDAPNLAAPLETREHRRRALPVLPSAPGPRRSPEHGRDPCSPLAGGFLTGKYTKGGPRVASQRSGSVSAYFTAKGWGVLDVVRTVAEAHGTTPSAVALSWQLAQPGITASIVGANTPQQLADQLPAPGLALNDTDLATLETASAPFRLAEVRLGFPTRARRAIVARVRARRFR